MSTPYRTSLAGASMGAHAVCTPDQVVGDDVRADVVIEAAGRSRAGDRGVDDRCGRHHGQHGVARSRGPILDLAAGPRRRWTNDRGGAIWGSAIPRRDVPLFGQMWREGRLPVEGLVSSTIGLSEINAAMDRLADSSVLRQVINFD